MRKLRICLLLFSLFWTPLLINTTRAQQPGKDKVQIMVLGVYHFHNPNADLVKTDFPDHLSDEKQRQISEVLDY